MLRCVASGNLDMCDSVVLQEGACGGGKPRQCGMCQRALIRAEIWAAQPWKSGLAMMHGMEHHAPEQHL
eukprot:2609563-Amphidinium_carterae.1